MLGAYKEDYKIGTVNVSCVADFENDKLHIYSSNGMKWHGELDEYTNFEGGNMRDFAILKLEAYGKCAY